ncbi:MAG: hypothetical protein KME17_26090 [Cyanosarcina radialis HA8281-LM2]|nr:hypothetical protein [Cyanosarcina radialis HA8281-LM2]
MDRSSNLIHIAILSWMQYTLTSPQTPPLQGATVYTHLALTLNPSPTGEGRKTLTA